RLLAVPATVSQLLPQQPIDNAVDVLAEVGAGSYHLPVDAGLNLAFKECIVVTLLWTTSLPRHAIADQAQRALCLVAARIETHLPQQRQDVHCGVPPAVPRSTAPPSVGRLEGKQPCSSALGRDPCPLGRHLFVGPT